jgi:hypothetical protein
MTNKDNTNVNIGENATVNVNDGKVSFSVNHMNKVAAAISATGGATAGIKMAKYVSGPPAVKVAAGVLTAGFVQTTTYAMSHLLDSNSSNDNINKLIDLGTILNNNTNNLYSVYPLNTLPDINSFLFYSIGFLYIILNIYIARYIISKDIIKYIPTSAQNNIIVKIFIY